MLAILSTVLGFLGPFVPEVIKFFRQKEDNKHELAVLDIQMRMAEAQHAYKMEEINANADIEEMKVIRLPQASFGVQILDAAKDWPRILILPVFYMFAFLDFLSGTVRPIVTYSIVGFFLMYKLALFELAKIRLGGWAEAATTIWNENDMALLMLCVGFYFGARTVKSVFGGSSNTGRVGGG